MRTRMRRRKKRRFLTEAKVEPEQVLVVSHSEESPRTDLSDEPPERLSVGFKETSLQMRPEVPGEAGDTNRDGDISQKTQKGLKMRRKWRMRILPFPLQLRDPPDQVVPPAVPGPWRPE